MLDARLIDPERPRPLRRAEYDCLVATGAFGDERIELLEGVLVEMSPQGTEHADAIGRLTMILAQRLAGRAIVRVQSPLAVSDESEPEPDVAVVAPGDYRRDHPTTAYLVIEVSAESLLKDLRVKTALYAGAAVPEYWVVDLAAKAIRVHTGLTNGHYDRVMIAGQDATLHPLALPGVEVAVSDILPA